MTATINHAETADADVLAALSSFPALAEREFRLLPCSGPDAPITETQGRGPGEALSPEGLSDLASSIATHGVLQPILVERRDDKLVVVAGERRFRAFQLALRSRPDLDHLQQGVPALVCPTEVGEAERRAWQLAENVCRADLAPGELGAALLFERCAILHARLISNNIDVSEEDARWPDPVQRWERLERVRLDAEAHHIGAPWTEVLQRLGIQLSESAARKVVRAVQSLPDGLSAEMDAEGVALTARVEWLRLAKGRREAATELWDVVKAMGRPDLLGSASKAALADPGASAEHALARAEAVQDEADANRARLISERWAEERLVGTDEGTDHVPAGDAPVVQDNTAPALGAPNEPHPNSAPSMRAPDSSTIATAEPEQPTTEHVDAADVIETSGALSERCAPEPDPPPTRLHLFGSFALRRTSTSPKKQSLPNRMVTLGGSLVPPRGDKPSTNVGMFAVHHSAHQRMLSPAVAACDAPHPYSKELI